MKKSKTERVLNSSTENSAVLKKVPSKDNVLKVVKKKSATGGIHLTFHSSSSSADDDDGSSSSSSTSSDSDTQTPVTASRPAQKKGQPRQKKGQPQQKKGRPVSNTPSPTTVSQSVSLNRNKAQNKTFKSPDSAGGGSQLQQSSGRGRGVSRVSRGTRGVRGRGRGRVVGGENDVLSVKNAVFTSPGERKRESGWEVMAAISSQIASSSKAASSSQSITSNSQIASNSKAASSSKDERMNSDEKRSTDATDTQLGNSVWEKSRVGFTEEVAEEVVSQPEVQDGGSGEGTTVEGADDDAVVRQEVVACRDYDSFPVLLGAPRIGDIIGFKVGNDAVVVT